MPDFRRHNGKSSSKHLYDFRYDGRRLKLHSDLWDDSRADPSSKSDYYKTFLFDGKQNYYHSQIQRGQAPDGIRIDPKNGVMDDRNQALTFCQGYPLFGLFKGDNVLVDVILREAENVYLHKNMSPVGGVDCYVIIAETKHGTYKVWFDPEHGCNISRAVMRKKEDDLFRDKPMSQTPFSRAYKNVVLTRLIFSITDVTFKQIDGVWVPMSGTMTSEVKLSNGDITRNQIIHQRTEVLIDPDHEALGSFVPDFPDGSTVKVKGDARDYVWQGGKYVPKSQANQDQAEEKKATDSETKPHSE